MKIEEVIKTKETRIIDVRTPQEFAGGSVHNAINIPLNEIPGKIENLKLQEGPMVICCASGMRSSQATQYLIDHGIKNVYNGGSWYDVNYLMNN